MAGAPNPTCGHPRPYDLLARERAFRPWRIDRVEPLPDVTHENFALLVAAGTPYHAAWRDACYSAEIHLDSKQNWAQNGARLMRDPTIAARVATIKEQLRQELADRIGISKDWIMGELISSYRRYAGIDPIVRTDGDGKVYEVYSNEPTAANQCLKMMGEELGMFQQKLKISGDPQNPIETRARVTVYMPSNGREGGSLEPA